MKIKRFVAADIRQAMRLVREDLGEEAVIMSNRSVPEGVEIVAARDFDEQSIRQRLKKQEQDNQPDVEDNNPHIISSRRKRELDDSYLSKKNYNNREYYPNYRDDTPLNNVHHFKGENRSAIDAHRTADKIPNSICGEEPATRQALLEMSRELKSIREKIDGKLSDAASVIQSPRNPTRLDLVRNLTAMGFSRKLSIDITSDCNAEDDFDGAWKETVEKLIGSLSVTRQDLLVEGGIVVLMGPTGVGKTTTLAKLAANFVLRHGVEQVAMVTTDNYRISAHEQINTYGKILGVPTRSASTAQELESVLTEFSDKKLVLVDTAGMSQRDVKLARQIRMLEDCHFRIQPYLVLSASTDNKSLGEMINAYGMIDPVAAIVTKFDETAVKGQVLSALIEHQLPLGYFADGQRVPEDIHRGDSRALITSCLSELNHENDYNDANDEFEWDLGNAEHA